MGGRKGTEGRERRGEEGEKRWLGRPPPPSEADTIAASRLRLMCLRAPEKTSKSAAPRAATANVLDDYGVIKLEAVSRKADWTVCGCRWRH